MTTGLLPYRESHPLLVSRAGALAAVCILSMTRPADGARIAEAIQDCVSIVVAALPYVVAGALAAAWLRRFLSSEGAHSPRVAALFALCNPGCDCALNGYADALARATPPVAGFVLTFAAIASPLALAMTCAVFGTRVALVRAAGAALAAGLTACALRSVSGGGSGPAPGCPRAAHAHSTMAAQLASALQGILISAAVAACGKALVPPSLFTRVPYAGAAAMAAVFSPCSSADPFMAASLLRDPHSQMAFMLCAQGAGLRQLVLLARTFGPARAIAGAACCGIACALVIALS